MNSRQKLVQQHFLNNEQGVISRLQQVYGQALQDIDSEIERLMERFDPETGDLPQSVVYQLQYQRQLRDQVGGILDRMQTSQFATVSEYLDTCYTDGFVGSVFDMHGQGVPLLMPIDQEAMVRAVQLESKISQGLYTRLGEDVSLLKRKITAQVSRGIATGMSFAQVAQQLAGATRIGYNNAVRIARTEGHRIQCTGAMDAMERAVENGADVVKQWDATLDDRTRESHVACDGQIRELDKPFGNGLKFPSDPSGGAAEVVNCRCALLQRARWALDDAELATLQERAAFYGVDKTEDFEEFRQRYLGAVSDTVVDTVVDAPRVMSVDECTTVTDVEELFRQQDWFIHGTGDLEGWRSDDELSLTGCDVGCAKGVYSAYAQFFDRFPQMRGKLAAPNAITIPKRRSGGVYAQCTVGFGSGMVQVNTSYFGNMERLIQQYAHDVATGFHPVGTSAFAIVTHELGHALDDYLSSVCHFYGLSGKNKYDFVSHVVRPRILKKSGYAPRDIASQVSGYATQSPQEFFAECFAEYMCSDNPRRVASEFGDWLTEIMERVT